MDTTSSQLPEVVTNSPENDNNMLQADQTRDSLNMNENKAPVSTVKNESITINSADSANNRVVLDHEEANHSLAESDKDLIVEPAVWEEKPVATDVIDSLSQDRSGPMDNENAQTAKHPVDPNHNIASSPEEMLTQHKEAISEANCSSGIYPHEPLDATRPHEDISSDASTVDSKALPLHSSVSKMETQTEVSSTATDSTINSHDDSDKTIEKSIIKSTSSSLKVSQVKKARKSVQFSEAPHQEIIHSLLSKAMPKLPLSQEFTNASAELAILDYVDNTWNLSEEWLRCIDYLGVSDGDVKEHKFRVRFSQPTRRKPIPSYTSSVYFTLVPSHGENEPMRVWYTMEGQRLVHKPEENTFREKWLKDILSSKAIICSETQF